MKAKISWLYAALLSFMVIGAVTFFFRTPPKKWRTSSESEFIISISNPQELLSDFDIVNEHAILHPNWYGIVQPLQFALINGIIKSIHTKLLLDFQKPLYLSVPLILDKKSLDSSKVVLSIYSVDGFTGAKNLSLLLSKNSTNSESPLSE